MKILVAFAFVMFLNVILFMGQATIDQIVLDEGITGTQLYNYEGSVLQKYDAGNYTLDEDLSNKLPTGQGQIEPESGNFFTDTFASMKSWFLSNPGLNYLYSFWNAFPNFLKQLNMPGPFSFAIGALWQSMMILLTVLVIAGRI